MTPLSNSSMKKPLVPDGLPVRLPAFANRVRMTPVLAGDVRGHLLGPLAVRPSHKSLGIGRELVRIAVEAARRKGSEAVILVGDPPYYQPLGFEKVAYGVLRFPGPVDPARVLVVPIGDDVHVRLSGPIAWRSQ
jgi:predicted N-acetyltransferase YhbS